MHIRKQQSHKRVHAGMHRIAARACRADRVIGDVKVKAHLTITADMDRVTVRHIRGNEQADVQAKAAHELQPEFAAGNTAAMRRQAEEGETETMRAV